MNIYLIRHGEAEKASGSKKDFDRALTSDGEKKIRIAAAGWKQLVPEFSHIISSPLTRAVQTAEIIAEVYKFTNKIIVDKRLTFGSRSEDVANLVNENQGTDIALVGHEPDFSEHVSKFICASMVNVDFKKGMIAKISFDGKAKLHRGVLEFLIPAKAYK